MPPYVFARQGRRLYPKGSRRNLVERLTDFDGPYPHRVSFLVNFQAVARARWDTKITLET